MKIEDNTQLYSVEFEKVKPGNCYEHNGKIHMKISNAEGFNSVEIESGSAKYICRNVCVFPVDAKVVIE